MRFELFYFYTYVINVTKVAYTVTVFSLLLCASLFYFVYALSVLSRTYTKGYPSYKSSQVQVISNG